MNMIKDEVLLDNADRIKALVKKGAAITKSISDFDFEKVVKKYVTNGGYNTKKSVDENFETLIKVISATMAMGKKLG